MFSINIYRLTLLDGFFSSFLNWCLISQFLINTKFHQELKKIFHAFFFLKSFMVIIENPNIIENPDITIVFICDFFLNSTSFCLSKIKNSIFFSWSLFVRTDLLCRKGCFILQNFSVFVI